MKFFETGKNFNWEKYYFDLEKGDPKKFPFWQFMIHETGDILYSAVKGFVGAFIAIFFLGIILSIIIQTPELLQEATNVFNSGFCAEFSK